MEKDRTLDYICELEKSIACFLKSAVDMGFDKVSASDAGEVADIIKDLSEAKKNHHESAYYEMMCENERLGYHYPNEGIDGSFRMQYRTPSDDWGGDEYAKRTMHNDKMGYHPNGEWEHDYGIAYDNYKNARRNYTSTNSKEYRTAMDSHAEDHLNMSVMTLKDIWRDADPTLKSKMKTELTSLVSSMTL